MEHAKLAALLLGASDADHKALLRHHAAHIDTPLAYALKDACLNGWSSDPATSLKANTLLHLLSKLKPNPEIDALAAWTSGIERLVLGRMADAIESLESSRLQFLALGKPLVAAATEVSKLIGLAMLGRYAEAVASGLRAREVFLAHGDFLAAGKIEHNLGNLSFRRDRYHEAEEFHSSAREHFALLNDIKQLATINNCLANTHVLLHKFASAEDLYEEAIGQAETAALPVTLAEIECNIGNFALLRGRYDRALDYLERSRRRYASLGMPHQSAIAELEIADAYLELNLISEAIEVYSRVEWTFRDLGMRAEAARALANHGRALILQGRPDEAMTLLGESRSLYAAEGNSVGEATSLLAEAQLNYARREYGQAKRILEQIQPVLVASGSRQRLLLAKWLGSEIERGLGDFSLSRSIARETLAEGEKHEQPQVVQRCETTLGLLAAGTNDPLSAEYHFRRAIVLTEDLRAPLPGEEFRSSFLINKLVPYEGLLKVCLAAGTTRWPEALAVAESARSRALAEKVGGNLKTLTKPRDEFEARLMRETETLSEELNYIYNQLDRPDQSETAGREGGQGELREALREREGKLMEISRQLQHKNQQESAGVERLNLPALQRQLGVDTALVEYVGIDDELIAFVVTNDRVEVLRNIASLAQVASQVAQFRFQIDTLRFGAAAVRRHLAVLSARVRKHLAMLYDALFRRVETFIGNRRRIVVVAEGGLHYLPFHALHDGESYLIERREVSYAPSALVLQQCLNKRASRRAHGSAFKSALLFGVADVNIPRVHDEVEVLSQLFAHGKVFLDESATLEALRQNAATADVVHLACHAQFRADNPLFSSLRLGNGWLTVRDAYGLELAGNLVTLSACETGVSAMAPGDELIGLARGFFAAGAPTLVLSLWTVDDEATAGLMTHFYTELQRTGSPSAALRAAQLKLLSEMPHPFFWSPFMLMGSW